jgi:ATP-dependent Clp protease adaptor protein ClpS
LPCLTQINSPTAKMKIYCYICAMAKSPPRENDDNDTNVITKTKAKTQKPSLYKVLLLNDDFTPMEFVVHVLEVYFNKSGEDATRIMLHVHQKGVGVCGVYTFEVAETKVTQVMDFAKQHGHPLQCTLEKE